jgi:hypothetical protein
VVALRKKDDHVDNPDCGGVGRGLEFYGAEVAVAINREPIGVHLLHERRCDIDEGDVEATLLERRAEHAAHGAGANNCHAHRFFASSRITLRRS